MGGECEGTGEGERRQKGCVVKEGVGGGESWRGVGVGTEEGTGTEG